ncbi:hypothetical protein N7475_008251 [Penicillium sp. IBT 31633x]|nr:hypothetical protein N7475_008251 [Penicillium sp. IBT 31633x]
MNSQDVSRKYDRFGHFKPVGEYDEQRGWLFEYSKGLRIESKILETIIGLDILLRQFTQRIDWLERKMQTMKKIECTQDDLKILQKYENEVKDYKHTILEFEGKLLDKTLPGISAKSSSMIVKREVDVAVEAADAASIVIDPKLGETESVIVQLIVGAVEFLAG